MGRIVIEVLFGLVSGLGGIVSGFFYLQSLQTGNNFLFLILSVVLVGIGVKLLFLSTNLIENMNRIPDPLANLSKSADSALNKKNELINEWKKTTENEARLKMLQLKANDNDNAQG